MSEWDFLERVAGASGAVNMVESTPATHAVAGRDSTVDEKADLNGTTPSSPTVTAS